MGIQNIGLYGVGGALVGAGLTTIAHVSTTTREQYQGALIGAAGALAMSVLRPIIAKAGAHFQMDERKIIVTQVAAQGLVSSIAIASFQSAELLNTPTTTLFGLLASIEPLYLLCDF